MRRSIAATFALAVICGASAGVAAVACGFDGAGSFGARGGALDASALPDGTPPGNAEGGEAIDGGAIDGGGEASGPLFEAGPITGYASRVTNGLIALYELEEGFGIFAHDSVALGVVLTIHDVTKAVWKPHALTFVAYTQVDSAPFPFAKAYATCRTTNEVTVEVWIESALTNADVHTRIATMATDNSTLDFALGTNSTDGIWASVKANENLTPAAKLTAGLTHLVMTRTAADATLRLYVDGAKVDELAAVEPLTAWPNVPLYVGGGSANDRGWRGSLHLLAVYSRALTPAEIAVNHAAGADP